MLKNLHLWLPSYLARHRPRAVTPAHLLFCFVDHYEPLWGKPSSEVALDRVRHWEETYPPFADQFRDGDGRPPQHTFFYPAEEYRPELLAPLEPLCGQGYGEVEIHLHHDGADAASLAAQLTTFKAELRNHHGFLSENREGELRYGFIHGNWALDNSRADGRWCGVNNELTVLRDTGCYADFTLPSAPSDTQTHQVNSIYYATDDPDQPKSHDRGVAAEVGGQRSEPGHRTADGRPRTADLLLIQGPLALNWQERKWGVLPRIEHADVAGHTPISPARVDLWVNQRIGVAGRPDWVFVKVHTHGAQESNFSATCGDEAVRMHGYLQSRYNDGERYRLHYVTAREMYNLVKAAEDGHCGNPNDYRDYLLPPPPIRR